MDIKSYIMAKNNILRKVTFKFDIKLTLGMIILQGILGENAILNEFYSSYFYRGKK